MLQVIIVIVVLCVVWSILKAIFEGIVEVIKEHPRAFITLLLTAIMGVGAYYTVSIGEMETKEAIAVVIGFFIMLQIIWSFIKGILSFIFKIRGKIILLGIDNYFKYIRRTINYQRMKNEIYGQYGGKRLDLSGTEYSDKYIEENIAEFIDENRRMVKSFAVDVVVNATRMSGREIVDALTGNGKNYCIGDQNFEEFIGFAVCEDERIKSLPFSSNNEIMYYIDDIGKREAFERFAGDDDDDYL